MVGTIFSVLSMNKYPKDYIAGARKNIESQVVAYKKSAASHLVGDKFKITEEDFKKLYNAFFAEIEAKFA